MKVLGMLFVLAALFSLNIHAADDVIDVENQVSNIKTEAEEEKSQPATKVAKNSVEKIEVTGSYIKRIDVEGPSPLVTIDKQDIANAGSNTVADFLQESELFDSSSTNGNREGYFRFHGQHAGNTLVLLNGMRMPKLGAPGKNFFNGVRSIPTNIIERVEILKDGSSALYGSDAMSGVVNFITKKDYDGAEVAMQTTIPEKGIGIEQNYTMSFGKNYSRGNWFVTAQYVNVDGFTSSELGSFYRDNRFRGAATNGDIRSGKQARARINPTCADGKPCQVDDFTMDQYQADNENIGALVSGRFDIDSDTDFSVNAFYNRRLRNSFGEARAAVFNQTSRIGMLKTSDLTGTSMHQKLLDSLNKENSLGDETEGVFRFNDEIGLTNETMTEDSYNVQTKLERNFGESWNWQFQNSYAFLREATEFRNGIVDMEMVKSKLLAGHDFNAPASQRYNAFADARVTPREMYDSQMFNSKLHTAGEISDFNNIWGAGGPIALAMGAEFLWQHSQDKNDAVFQESILNIDRGENLTGQRSVGSGFVELTGYPLESIEVQMAGRYDNYSDAGGTFNPKFAVAFRPSSKILFRSSWGTNFLAPALRNMIQPDFETAERFDDEVTGDEDKYYRVLRYRDPNLGPETSVHYNIGTVVQPNRNWSFTIDQWNFQGKNTIAKIFGSQLTEFETIVGNDGLADLGVTIERDPLTNEIRYVKAQQVVNMGSRTIRGLDFGIEYNHKVKLFGAVMNMNIASKHSHFLVYKTKRFITTPVQFREDLEWENNTSISLANRNHAYRLAARSFHGEGFWRSGGRIDSYRPTHTVFDLGYNFNVPWGGRFSVTVKNMLDARAPINLQTARVSLTGNDGNFNALGRRYVMGYSHTF